MKQLTGIVAFLGCLVLALPSTARAGEYQAIAVCRSGDLTNSYINQTGIASNTGSSITKMYCPLKAVSCSTGSCSYTADVYSADFNGVDANDSNVRCQLRFHGKNDSTYYTSGSMQTNNVADGNFHKMSLSMSVSSVWDGYIYVYCEMGKDSVGGDHSWLSWIGNTNF